MTMPARIPTEIKDSVVQSWLCGLTRRPNAKKHGVSEGSVDNCVNGWTVQHGPDGEYDRVRALAVAISKTGLSIQECAEGHRVAMIMKNMGVEAELQWDSQLKEKLDKNGLKNEDVSKFVNATLLMKERGYNIFEIIEKFSKFEKIDDACAFIQLKEGEARIRHDQLTKGNKALEDRI